MALPLVAAGIKVAGKALIKKIGTKLAQKGAQKIAQEGVKKVGKSVVQKGAKSGTNQFQKARNIYDKAKDIKKTKDNILGEEKNKSQLKEHRKTESKNQESTDSESTKKQENKWPFYIAMFFAIVKDAIEILLTPASPILTFLPTIIIASVLLLSGKKGTMKIVMSLLTTVVDFLIPGLNVLPMTTIAIFITMKPESNKLPLVNNEQIQKVMKNVKKFIK